MPEAVPISYSNYFDGVVGTYITTPVNTAFNVGAGNFTVEGWYYFNSLIISQQEIFTFSGATTFNFIMFVWNDGVIYFRSAETSGEIVSPFASGMVVGVWYHWAVTRVGNVYTIYRNGVSVASATSTAIVNENKSFSTGKKLSGHVSNVRVIKGTALYTSTFTPSTTPLTTTSQSATASQVSLLTCQSTTIIDNSTNAFTITAAGNTVPRIFNPFGYTEQSGTSYTPSIHGGSVYFDGTGDWLTAPDNDALDLGSSNFTVEGWFYQTGNFSTSGGGTGLVTKWTDASNQRGWQFAIRNAASTVTFYYSTTGSDFPVVTFSSVTLTSNTWTHFALVRNGSTLNLYKDGALAGTSAFTSTIYNSTSPLAVGAWFGGSAGVPDTAGGNSLFQGYISNVRVVKGTAVYTSAFVPPTQTIGNYSTSIPSTLLLNFNNGGIVDQHGTNVLETAGNIQLSTSIKKYNNASMYFGTKTDYLALRAIPGLITFAGDFTIECWVYPSDNTVTFWGIFDSRQTGASGVSLAFAIDPLASPVAGSYRMKYYNGTSYYGTITVLSGQWTHLAWVRVGSTMTFYVNGVAGGTATISGVQTGAATTNPIYIGSKDNGLASYGTVGYIDDLRITNGFARYTANFTAPTTALSLR